MAKAVALSLLAIMSVYACAPKQQIKKQVGVVSTAPIAPPGALKNVKPYTINGETYYPLSDAYGYEEVGIASWYGKDFHGKPTANGETYDMHGVSAAHKTLPLGTMVEVTRLDNNEKLAVRINDRGPFVPSRIIDLSYGAAQKLGIATKGTAKVKVVAMAEGAPVGESGTPSPVKPLPDFKHGRFFVQVGAFSVASNAELVKERLAKTAKEGVRLQPYNHPAAGKLLRVQSGPYSDIDKAKEALVSIKGHGFNESFVVADQ